MKESFLIVPEEVLRRIDENQTKILSMLENGTQSNLNEFITEIEAKQLFKRKSTWFWQMRKNGILPFSKVGKSIYYSVNDLKKVLSDSKQK